MAENQGNETGKGAKRQRGQFSAVEKRRLLDETEKPGESVSTVARRYCLSGSIYTSNETRAFGAEIGFIMCTAPPSRLRATAWPSPSSRASNATTFTSLTCGRLPTCSAICRDGLTTTTACARNIGTR
jgi:hypothetical protein